MSDLILIERLYNGKWEALVKHRFKTSDEASDFKLELIQSLDDMAKEKNKMISINLGNIYVQFNVAEHPLRIL
jgi:hypothetical protein